MPTKISKWTCDICKSEYLSEKRAENCEKLGFPPETNLIKEGREIEFTREVPRQDDDTKQVIEGDVKTYVKGRGTVLAKEVKYNANTNKHHDLFIVETEDERGKYEGLVALLNINGKNELFMAANPRYKCGFADSMKSTKIQASL